MIRYALPLIPYMLGLTLLSQFDRVLIDRFYGKEATGLYSLSYNVGVLLLMVATAILNALNPSFFRSLNSRDNDQVHRDARFVFSVAAIATSALVLLGVDVANNMLPMRYAEGFALIPTVAFSGLCFVIFQIWVRVLAFAHCTVTISVLTFACALLNIGLNLWLLPTHGWPVAAWTTVATYTAMSVACVIAVNRLGIISTIRLWREGGWVIALGALVIFLNKYSVPLTARLVILAGIVWLLRNDLANLIRRSRA